MPADKRPTFRSFQKYLTGEKVPPRKRIRQLEGYLQALRVRLAGRPLKPVTLQVKKGAYQTRLMNEVGNWLEYAVKHREKHILLLVATWGHGKTFAAQQVLANGFRHPSHYMETRPQATAYTLIDNLHRRLSAGSTGSTDDKIAAIVDRLVADPVVLVIDQAEELTNGALNQLAYIWDQTKAPVILLASPLIEARLTTYKSSRNIARLRRRLWRVQLPAPAPEEISAIVRNLCGARPWSEGAFQEFYSRTGAGDIGRAIAGGAAINQVIKSTRGTTPKTPITRKLLEVALRPLL